MPSEKASTAYSREIPRGYTQKPVRPAMIPTEWMGQLLYERIGAGNPLSDELRADLIRRLQEE